MNDWIAVAEDLQIATLFELLINMSSIQLM